MTENAGEAKHESSLGAILGWGSLAVFALGFGWYVGAPLIIGERWSDKQNDAIQLVKDFKPAGPVSLYDMIRAYSLKAKDQDVFVGEFSWSAIQRDGPEYEVTLLWTEGTTKNVALWRVNLKSKEDDRRAAAEVMNIVTFRIQKPDDVNLILGQAHFIKTVEDLHEALVGAVPGIRFGAAFCESSGPCLVRHSGTDEELIGLAQQQAFAIAAGHSFLVFLRGTFPINVLNAVKMIPEVCRIYCATANAVEVVIAETDQGRGILGVVDGNRTQGIEDAAQVAERKALLRRFGYKL
jgi:adenosine/AMP kinase